MRLSSAAEILANLLYFGPDGYLSLAKSIEAFTINTIRDLVAHQSIEVICAPDSKQTPRLGTFAITVTAPADIGWVKTIFRTSVSHSSQSSA